MRVHSLAKRPLGADLHRVAGPHVVQAERDLAVLDEQFVSAAAGVDRSLAVMHQHGPLHIRRRLHANLDAERIVAGEVADAGEYEAVFAAEPHTVRFKLRVVRRAARRLRVRLVRHLARLQFVELPPAREPR